MGASLLRCAPFCRTSRPYALILASVLLLLTAAPVLAHGGGKQQIAGEPSGPYRLYVWTSPDPWRVGEAHTTVAVTRLLPSGEETPATGLQVFVTYQQAQNQTGSQAGQGERVAAVEQVGAQQGFYEADGPVADAGDWQVAVAVSGAEGEGAVSFREAVLPANQFNWWLIGGGVLLALLLLGYFGTRKARLPGRPSASPKTAHAQRGGGL